jgi:protein-S-isoprenylcysteine O-methyltransferase Ste14
VPLAALGYFSPLAAAISIVAYVLAMTWLVIRGEERGLQKIFGSAFEAYCNRTPRWIGVKKV